MVEPSKEVISAGTKDLSFSQTISAAWQKQIVILMWKIADRKKPIVLSSFETQKVCK